MYVLEVFLQDVFKVSGNVLYKCSDRYCHAEMLQVLLIVHLTSWSFITAAKNLPLSYSVKCESLILFWSRILLIVS